MNDVNVNANGATAPELTWVDKILAKLKLGDNGKVAKFNNYAKKQYQKQIDILTRKQASLQSDAELKILELQDKLDELHETYADAGETISIEAINSVDNFESALAGFEQNLQNIERAIAAKEKEIDTINSTLDAEIAKITSDIVKCEKRLNLLK